MKREINIWEREAEMWLNLTMENREAKKTRESETVGQKIKMGPGRERES